MKSTTLSLLCLLLAAFASAAFAADTAAVSLSVRNAWARATAPGAPVGGAYFEIVNSGPSDTLTAIECPVARRVEIHSMKMVAGMMEMRPLQALDIPAGGRVTFGPDSLHAMLIDLRRPLTQGERIPLTLVFRHAGRVPVEAIVGGLGDMTPPATEAASSASHH